MRPGHGAAPVVEDDGRIAGHDRLASLVGYLDEAVAQGWITIERGIGAEGAGNARRMAGDRHGLASMYSIRYGIW